MIWKKLGTLVVLLIFIAFGGVAQRATQLKINEVMVKNTNNYQDDYGVQSPWIELFNTAYATVDIGGCYLSNDKADLMKYMVPKGDVLTKIKARQHIVFWADNLPNRGTFHVNFRLDTVSTNTLYLVDSNGKDIIDSVYVSWNGSSQSSYGRCSDGLDFVLNTKTDTLESAWKTLHIVTPNSNNAITTGKEYQTSLANSYPDGVGNTIISTGAVNEKFKKSDSIGIGMSFIAMFIVFIALILLYLMFKIIGNISINLKRRRYMRTQGVGTREMADKLAKNTGEIYAAIAMALYELENEAHDWEETTLTIDKVAKPYSPWSSKIYGLREVPNKR